MRLRDVRVVFPGTGRSVGPWTVDGPDTAPWLILGPSGSGKTTFLKVLTGRIPFKGEVTGAPPPTRCAFVPQFPERVLSGRNLAEDLSNRLHPGAETRRDLRALLRDQGLSASLHREAATLSGGEKRRLVMALLTRAGWGSWGWDEPEAGLDAPGRRHLWVWLNRALQTSPGPFWWATSSPWMYFALNPYLVILKKGGVVFAGNRDEALSSRDTRELLGLSAHPAQKAWRDIGKGVRNLDDNVWKKLSFLDPPVPQLQVVLRDSEVDC